MQTLHQDKAATHERGLDVSFLISHILVKSCDICLSPSEVSLSTILSSSLHVVTNGNVLSFLDEKYSTVYTYIHMYICVCVCVCVCMEHTEYNGIYIMEYTMEYFIHSLIDGHLGCSHILATKNHTVMIMLLLLLSH